MVQEVAANLLGYISEVNNFDIRNNPYYVKGELIGRQGIEKTYEEVLATIPFPLVHIDTGHNFPSNQGLRNKRKYLPLFNLTSDVVLGALAKLLRPCLMAPLELP